MRRFTDAQILAIRASSEALHALARRYGTHYCTMRNIKLGLTYKDVGGLQPLAEYRAEAERRRRHGWLERDRTTWLAALIAGGPGRRKQCPI
jgi:hypothetical protein